MLLRWMRGSGSPAFRWAALLLAALLLALAVAACASGDPAPTSVSRAVSQEAASTAAAPPPPATPARAAPTPAPQTASAAESSGDDGSGQGTTTGFFLNSPLSNEALSSVLPQNRVIVRTVDLGLIVDNVAQSADAIVGMTRRYGGWVVSSDRSRTHQASLSVRVAAELLDDFVLAVRNAAASVEYETSNSQDITDDFVDNQARLNGLRRTEERLLAFLQQAVNVEEALNVQAELARIQLEIEEIEGRLRFMQETAAYSLVNLRLTTKPGDMTVEIGENATFRAGVNTGFRAVFRAPEGVDEFNFTWDFGDGSPVVSGRRTAPTVNAGERVTATASHTYTDVERSPYIIELNISGIGEAGLFLGTDTMIATVSEIPTIEVFAGDDRVVDEGDAVEYGGSFTRPESLWDFQYRWDFGDGTATVFDAPAAGETRAVVNHTFRDHRPNPYPVVLIVTAQSDAGEIRGAAAFNVQVNEVPGFVVAGWDVGGTVRSAVRALSAVGRVLLVALIWIAVFSPVWLGALAVVFFLPRLRRRFGWGAGGGPSVGLPQIPWRPGPPGGPDATPATPTAEADTGAGGLTALRGISPPADGGAASSATPGEPPPEQPTAQCPACCRAYPAADPEGRPAQFCPYCGTAAAPGG